MSFYRQLISQATSITDPGDLEAIESMMRVIHHTLDGLTRREFDEEARIAWRAVQRMRAGDFS